MSDLVAAALDYAALGWAVFPCSPINKQPLIEHGFKAASTDPQTIKAWLRKWPNAMLGVATGATTGIVVLDVDRDDEKGLDGEASLAALLSGASLPPDLTAVRTPRGGRHFYFDYPKGVTIRNSVGKLGPGLDVRGEGGYVIVPPSVNADGGAYRWEPEQWGVLYPPPDFMLPKSRENEWRQTKGPELDDKRRNAYGDKVLADECRMIACAPEGSRNDQLNRSAFALFQLVAGEVLREGEVRDALLSAAAVCRLPIIEAQKTIDSAKAAGMREPRTQQGRDCQGSIRNGRAGEGDLRAEVDISGQEDGVSVDERAAAVAVLSIQLTQDDAARLFAMQVRGHLLFDHTKEEWFEWTGVYWREDDTRLAYEAVRRMMRSLTEPLNKRKGLRATNFASGVEKFARGDPALATTALSWNPDQMLLGTPGGTSDLRTGGLRPARAEERITKQTLCAPADEADCPHWIAFLEEATGGDKELIRFLQQWAGYSLTGEIKEQALIFLYGPGGNGKSVFINVLVKLMGTYAAAAPMDTFVEAKGERHPTELAFLHGPRLVVASETQRGRAWNEARVKQLTGGDDITARFMNKDFFTFTPRFKLTIIGNHQPKLRVVDDATKRRFNIVPFTVKPKAVDKDLEAKLIIYEGPQILRWMIDGALDWQANGLVRPHRVIDATQQYFAGQDEIGRWIDEHCVADPAALTRLQELLDAFWEFLIDEDLVSATEEKMPKKAFKAELIDRGFREGRNERMRGIAGLRLRTREEAMNASRMTK